MPNINVARVVEIDRANKPVPGLNNVLVKVEACCLVPNAHNLVTNGGKDRFALPDLPCVFGLDASGVVEAVGDRVFGIKPGDRVYVDPLLTCGNCHHCRRGMRTRTWQNPIYSIVRSVPGLTSPSSSLRKKGPLHQLLSTSILCSIPRRRADAYPLSSRRPV